jgi:glutathione peroxidase-family protein
LLTLRATQVVLMTNVASACGYTRSNYSELVALHEKYNKQGLEIVAFPCNQVRFRSTLGLLVEMAR